MRKQEPRSVRGRAKAEGQGRGAEPAAVGASAALRTEQLPGPPGEWGGGEQKPQGAFPLLVPHLKFRTGTRPSPSPLLHHDRKGVSGGPRGAVTRSWTAATRGPRASAREGQRSLPGGGRRAGEDGGEGALCPLCPGANEAGPWGGALQQLWEGGCSGPPALTRAPTVHGNHCSPLPACAARPPAPLPLPSAARQT